MTFLAALLRTAPCRARPCRDRWRRESPRASAAAAARCSVCSMRMQAARYPPMLRKRSRGRQRLPLVAHQRHDGAHAQRLAHVARQRLRHRAVVLHPVEFPDVPDIRVTHRRVAHLVVRRDEVIAEHGIADAAQRIGAAKALVHGDRARRSGGSGRCRAWPGSRCEQRLPELGLAIAGRRAPAPSARSDRTSTDCVQCSSTKPAVSGAKLPRCHVGERMHGRAAVDADGARAAVRRVVDFARVAGRAGDVEHLLADTGIEVPREADGQLVRIGRGWAAGRRGSGSCACARDRRSAHATAAARGSRTSYSAPRRPMRPAASTFPVGCSSSAAATPSSAPLPSPGPAIRIHQLFRVREWCAPATTRT